MCRTAPQPESVLQIRVYWLQLAVTHLNSYKNTMPPAKTLSEERVAQILAKYNLKLTRLSDTPSLSGSALVGLIEKVGV